MIPRKTVHRYDRNGRLTNLRAASGTVTTFQYDSAGKKLSSQIEPETTGITAFVNGFRLSASSSSPVTTSDTSSTSIYLTPYVSDQIALYYDGSWALYASSAVSAALSTAAGTVYDVFAYYNGSAVALSLVAWSSTTTRATALGYQDGVLVLSTDSTKLYVGTIYCATADTVNDKASQRHVWNYYNRVGRQLLCEDTTSSWTYTSTTIRASNSNTTDGVGRVSFVLGESEDSIHASYSQTSGNGPGIYNGVGLDSTTAMSFGSSTAGEEQTRITPSGILAVSAGYHYLQKLEALSSSGTQTMYGFTSSTDYSSGYMTAELLA